MTKDKKTICVYCSSSNSLPQEFYELSKELGTQIGLRNYNMVYGGSTRGMMGMISNYALNNGANVIGVIPERINQMVVEHNDLVELIITKDMRERKATMEKYADIFIAAPGGFGTFEEIFEIFVAKQLGYHNKPIIFLNFNHYYDNLFKMFETLYENNFAKRDTTTLYKIAYSVEEVFEYIENYTPPEYIIKF